MAISQKKLQNREFSLSPTPFLLWGGGIVAGTKINHCSFFYMRIYYQ
jgi:hypothetical protein